MKQTPIQRINRILRFYLGRGINKESVNKVQRKILSQKFDKIVTKDAEYYQNQFKPKSFKK